jgi:hypothetical protein
MSSRRVGQGRVYVQLGPVDQIAFASWCRGLARGQSYVSDGFAHALAFTVDGQAPGTDDVSLDQPGGVLVRATVAFAPEIPQAVAYGGIVPEAGRRLVGDTVNLHAPRSTEVVQGGARTVELIVNGRVAGETAVPADGQTHDLQFTVPVDRSSWIALRQFPQLHTNPVNVIVAGRPIRASRQSALWFAETIKLLWTNRHHFIAEPERPEAKRTYDRAIEMYERIAGES